MNMVFLSIVFILSFCVYYIYACHALLTSSLVCCALEEMNFLKTTFLYQGKRFEVLFS